MSYSNETKGNAIYEYSIEYRSAENVAKELGCDRNSIRRWVRAVGYRVRSIQEGKLRVHEAAQYPFDERWRKVPPTNANDVENIYAAYFDSAARIGAMFDVGAPENCAFVLEYAQVVIHGYARTTIGVSSSTCYVHRLLAASIWGEIDPDDDVHHIDDDPLNNDPANFEIIPHDEHSTLHRRRW